MFNNPDCRRVGVTGGRHGDQNDGFGITFCLLLGVLPVPNGPLAVFRLQLAGCVAGVMEQMSLRDRRRVAELRQVVEQADTLPLKLSLTCCAEVVVILGC